MPEKTKVVIWNEFIHERSKADVRAIYPDGIHTELKNGLLEQLGDTVNITCCTLDQPDHGLSENLLNETDVLLWWGHAAHDQVQDNVVARVYEQVLKGMGLIVLHSGHGSKIFRKLMGTECMLRWRDCGELERLWVVAPGHPILQGIQDEYFEIQKTEMYGEHFDIPEPDEVLLISWFEGGEVFRSACTFRRGQGKIFYFRPGHETFPIYYDTNVRRILGNAVAWSKRISGNYNVEARHIPNAISPLKQK